MEKKLSQMKTKKQQSVKAGPRVSSKRSPRSNENITKLKYKTQLETGGKNVPPLQLYNNN